MSVHPQVLTLSFPRKCLTPAPPQAPSPLHLFPHAPTLAPPFPALFGSLPHACPALSPPLLPQYPLHTPKQLIHGRREVLGRRGRS